MHATVQKNPNITKWPSEDNGVIQIRRVNPVVKTTIALAKKRVLNPFER